ncbi:Rsd/AlgQ family anti-sigma factor [Thiolapillus sp.]
MAERENKEGASGELRHALDELLAERKQLLAVFYQAATANQEDGEESHAQLFTRLCQLLMDYTALWQFEIHDVLVHSAAEHSAAVKALELHQPVIQQAANDALDFNDMFDAAVRKGEVLHMESRLSMLGESLANRFEAEDQVVLKL